VHTGMCSTCMVLQVQHSFTCTRLGQVCSLVCVFVILRLILVYILIDVALFAVCSVCLHQISSSAWGGDGYAAWEHPLDIHMTTQKLEVRGGRAATSITGCGNICHAQTQLKCMCRHMHAACSKGSTCAVALHPRPKQQSHPGLSQYVLVLHTFACRPGPSCS
jgi:hypothetical protein